MYTLAGDSHLHPARSYVYRHAHTYSSRLFHPVPLAPS